MKIRLAAPLQPDSIVDGEGIRTVLWTQGCIHNCKGCHNPSTHSFDEGVLIDVEDVKEELASFRFQDGITLSGGDPFCQPEAVYEIAKYAKEIGLNVWCYTGYTFEKLLLMSKKNKHIYNLLNSIDVLVDGKFELDKRSLNCAFRGSTNQRLIDVKKSIENDKIVEITKYDENEIVSLNKQNKYVFI